MTYEEFKAATIAVLEDWFQALEDGTAEYRFPDPRFVRPSKPPLSEEEYTQKPLPPYTDEDVDRIVAAIDEEIQGEIARNTTHWRAKGIQTDSGFLRLGPLQRRALVEELARVAAQDRSATEQSDTEYYNALMGWEG